MNVFASNPITQVCSSIANEIARLQAQNARCLDAPRREIEKQFNDPGEPNPRLRLHLSNLVIAEDELNRWNEKLEPILEEFLEFVKKYEGCKAPAQTPFVFKQCKIVAEEFRTKYSELDAAMQQVDNILQSCSENKRSSALNPYFPVPSAERIKAALYIIKKVEKLIILTEGIRDLALKVLREPLINSVIPSSGAFST